MSGENERTQVAPRVHRNGTSREALEAQLRECHRTLGAAIAAMEAAAPNARDYYVQGPGTWERAQLEHTTRLLSVRRVQLELATIWERISDG